MKRPIRATIATAPTAPAPFRILALTLPLWGCALLLLIAMPITAVLTLLVLTLCLFVLPFKARRGLCPNCQRAKLLPFNGVGGLCKGCGVDLVLREDVLHQIEPRTQPRKPPKRTS